MLGSSFWYVNVLGVVVILDLLHKASPVSAYTRADFPCDFVFGASSSALQVEGAASQDGRTPSFLDRPVRPEYEHDGYKMDVACDQYHKYKEDVKLMAETGLEAYKFSISWPRLMPHGRGPVNPKAVEYYNNLIDELISHGIQPHVMLWHWDLPLDLWDEYGGRISRKFVADFTAYADVCFREFGDRVLHWTTINEGNTFPVIFCNNASKWSACTSGADTYITAHYLLLGHASAATLYRAKYQEKQHGYIGMNLNPFHYIPQTDAREDILATQRVKDFHIGWFMNPLMHGDYPETMKKLAGNRLPSFTKRESQLIRNSFDFISINCYLAASVAARGTEELEHPNYYADSGAKLSYHTDNVNEEILHPILEWFKQDYGDPVVYIYENGPRTLQNSTLNDTSRVAYLNASIGSVLSAIRNGSRVQGYLMWSFLDMPEPDGNLELTYGLYYVNFSDPDLRRYPKSSAYWYASFLKENVINAEPIQQTDSSSALSQAM